MNTTSPLLKESSLGEYNEWITMQPLNMEVPKAYTISVGWWIYKTLILLMYLTAQNVINKLYRKKGELPAISIFLEG